MTFDEITETPENTAIANNTKPIIYIIDLKFRQFYDIMNAKAFIIYYLKPLQIRRSSICSLQSGNYIITLRFYDIMLSDTINTYKEVLE